MWILLDSVVLTSQDWWLGDHGRQPRCFLREVGQLRATLTAEQKLTPTNLTKDGDGLGSAMLK